MLRLCKYVKRISCNSYNHVLAVLRRVLTGKRQNSMRGHNQCSRLGDTWRRFMGIVLLALCTFLSPNFIHSFLDPGEHFNFAFNLPFKMSRKLIVNAVEKRRWTQILDQSIRISKIEKSITKCRETKIDPCVCIIAWKIFRQNTRSDFVDTA